MDLINQVHTRAQGDTSGKPGKPRKNVHRQEDGGQAAGWLLSVRRPVKLNP